MKTVQEQLDEVIAERDTLKMKLESLSKFARKYHQEVFELQLKTFKWFNNEECWIYQDDYHDYPHSIACPVVMSADQFRHFMKLENKR